MHPLHPPLFAADPRNLYNPRLSSVESGTNKISFLKKWLENGFDEAKHTKLHTSRVGIQVSPFIIIKS